VPEQKRLLFLNRSFYPDVEATGQLLTQLCEDLAQDFHIQVICGNPVYRRVRTLKPISKSQHGRIITWRINSTSLPKKYFWARFLNLLTYFMGCLIWALLLKKTDMVIAETDPPLLASIAYLLSRLRRSVFLYYPQDIWPEAGIVNKRLTNPVLTNILRSVNGFLYREANQIIVPGADMKDSLVKDHSLPPDKITVVENWTDPEEVYPVKREDNDFLRTHGLEKKFVVMYSGNIGLSQDLENVVAAADGLRGYEEIIFILVGEGALKEALFKMASSRKLENIKFLPYQQKRCLKYSLNAAHIHLIPLKRGMKGIIVPSKVYGIMAASKPFIAAVDEGSEIDSVVKRFGCGLVVKPSAVEALKKAVLWAFRNQEQIEMMGQQGRKAFEVHYTRAICTQKFRSLLNSLI